MKHYIKNGQIFTFQKALGDGYEVSMDIAKQKEMFVELTKKQYQFHVDNPSASIEEILACELREVPEIELTPAEKRKQTYETIPTIEWENGLITVDGAVKLYSAYSAEQKTEKANEISALIISAKESIRKEIPD